MKLTKENVCVFIESEAQLKEARKMLEKYGEYLSDYVEFRKGNDVLIDFIQLGIKRHVKGWWPSDVDQHESKTQITLQQLEEILKEEK
jgi:hypothetical protein